MIPSGRGKREKHSPATLKHLAANKAVENLFHTSKNLHNIIQKELSKSKVQLDQLGLLTKYEVGSNTSSRSENSGITNSTTNSVSSGHDAFTSSNSSISGGNNNIQTCTDAAYRVLHVRKFVANKLCPETKPILLQHTIAKAMETKDIPLVRLAIGQDAEILDFRARDYYLHRSVVPHSISKPCKSKVATFCSSLVSYTHSNSSFQNTGSIPSRAESYASLRATVPQFSPPDEHDWFARDKMGKIISLSEACELFSITKMSQCSQTLKEFYINATRPTYYAASREILPVIPETLTLFSSLTTLVLRGMTDDYMLQIIGEISTVLRHLDISGSKFVSDVGIRNLFFSDVSQNSAMYMIPSWVSKNEDKLNQLAKTIEYFDCSWTSVTDISRKIIATLPGCYMFRRIFSKSEEEAYGQHIFIKKPPEFTNKIQPKLGKIWSVAFEAHLQSFTGPKGLKGICRFLEFHPWNNCVMNLFIHDESFVRRNHLEDNPTCSAIVTPNENERRIYGGFTFYCGNVTEIYSIFPLNINLVGESFPKLKILRGNVTDTWRLKCSLLPELTDLEIFAPPLTAVSIFEFCPNMKRVKIRIVKEPLCDDHLLLSIPNSMCRRTLEDLWIAPGVYGTRGSSTAGSTANNRAFISSSTDMLNAPEVQQFLGIDSPATNSHFYLEDLVNLSLECIRALIKECKALRRLGDISWWTLVNKSSFLDFCEEQKAQNSVMALIWENLLLPEHEKDSL